MIEQCYKCDKSLSIKFNIKPSHCICFECWTKSKQVNIVKDKKDDNITYFDWTKDENKFSKGQEVCVFVRKIGIVKGIVTHVMPTMSNETNYYYNILTKDNFIGNCLLEEELFLTMEEAAKSSPIEVSFSKAKG